jgi:hypothetical protein
LGGSEFQYHGFSILNGRPSPHRKVQRRFDYIRELSDEQLMKFRHRMDEARIRMCHFSGNFLREFRSSSNLDLAA